MIKAKKQLGFIIMDKSKSSEQLLQEFERNSKCLDKSTLVQFYTQIDLLKDLKNQVNKSKDIQVQRLVVKSEAFIKSGLDTIQCMEYEHQQFQYLLIELKNKVKQINMEFKVNQSSNKKLNVLQLLEEDTQNNLQDQISPFEFDVKDSLFESFSLHELERLPKMVQFDNSF